MKYIISVLKYVVSYLENEYEPNETIYKEFNV